MKFFSTLVVFILITFQLIGQSLIWGPEIPVIGSGHFGNIRPKVVLTSGNIPLVMWGGGQGTQPLYVARWNGSNFDTPVKVTPGNLDPMVSNWAGCDMAARGDTVFVVYKVEPEANNFIYSQKSIDGGITWADTVRVDIVDGPLTRFPNIAISPEGNPSVMFMEFGTGWSNPQYKVSNSTDGGLSYMAAVGASSGVPGEVCDCCIATQVNNGMYQVSVFRRNDVNLRDMWAAVSTDTGGSFNQLIDVDNTNWVIPACMSSGPSAGISGDSLIVTFMSGAFGPYRVQVSTANLLTQTLGFNVELAGNYPIYVSQNYPRLANKQDTIGITWEQTESGNVDCYLSWSVSGSLGLFGTEVMVNNTGIGGQRNPEIAYGNRVFHLIFQDDLSGDIIYKTATISAPVGDQILNNKFKFSIGPNPFVSNTWIKVNDETQITLFDITGKPVRKYANVNGLQLIERDELQSGIYFCRMTTKGGVLKTVKLVLVE